MGFSHSAPRTSVDLEESAAPDPAGKRDAECERMTRDEQIAEAERIARLNPEWSLHRDILSHDSGSRVRPSAIWGRYVAIRGDFGGPSIRPRLCAGVYLSPAAAIRALGFTINEQEG